MYAATSISPYHSVEELQQNIHHQPNTNANDYFSLNKGGNAGGQ